jgi:hypothetical protein
MISKRELKRREREIERLAQCESNVWGRLIDLRADLDRLGRDIDRFAPVPRRRSDRGVLPDLENLLPFRKGRYF